MKAWFQKFRISNALNDHRPMPLANIDHSVRSAGTRHFAAQCQALEQGLKSQPPAVTSPAGLHEAIMREVRTTTRTATARRREWFPRWQLAGSCLLVAGLGMILENQIATPAIDPMTAEAAHSLALASSALDQGTLLVCAAPAAVLAPLAAESESLDQDLARAGNFIIASLP